MQLLKKKKRQGSTPEQDLLRQLFEAKAALDVARNRFEYMTEPEMVASCIYEMRAEQARYTYLLGKVRDLGLSLSDRGLIEDLPRKSETYF